MSVRDSLELAGKIATGSVGHVGRELELSLAIIDLEIALLSCRQNDRTPAYKPGEERRDGKRPALVNGQPGRWLTPVETVDLVMRQPADPEPDTPHQTVDSPAAAALAVERANHNQENLNEQ